MTETAGNGLQQALQAAAQGDSAAADQVFALLYAELRQLASSRLRQHGDVTLLNTTALVHECYLRMRGMQLSQTPERRQYLAYASRAMRSVVVDLVRSRQAERHGGGLQQVTWSTDLIDRPDSPAHHDRKGDEALRVHEALQDLATLEPRLATVVELRYFGGLSETEVASVLDVTVRTVQRDWAKARLYLSVALG